jgi:hypothetical protein
MKVNKYKRRELLYSPQRSQKTKIQATKREKSKMSEKYIHKVTCGLEECPWDTPT